jgi:predicted nucleic acid-binding protein
MWVARSILVDLSYLLDTNVISELQKPRPNAGVRDFLTAAVGRFTCISVLTVGELRRGAELKRRRDTADAARLDTWIDRLEADYAGRVIPVSRDVATLWGRISADRSRPVVDTIIAATALVHGLTLVTRDVRDVAGTGVNAVNPWLGESV